MTNNPLIAKWEELHNPKKEPPKKVEGEKTIADELKFQGTITIPITKPNNFIPTTNASVSFIPKPYTRHDSTIATLEALLEDLKSGRAIMTNCRTDDNYNHLDLPIPCSSLPSSEFVMNSYLSVERGQRIALEIFRKYD